MALGPGCCHEPDRGTMNCEPTTAFSRRQPAAHASAHLYVRGDWLPRSDLPGLVPSP